MAKEIEIKIEPNEHCFVNEYDSTIYNSCYLHIYFPEEDILCTCGANDKVIIGILETLEDYFHGRIDSDIDIYLAAPWNMGKGIIKPYAFEIDGLRCLWTFKFETPRQLSDGRYIDAIDLSHDQLLSMYDQLTAQFNSFDWRKIGKIPLYRFSTSNKDFEWCYYASTLQRDIEKLAVGQEIKAIYVSAANYLDPLHERENYVNYLDICSQIIMVLNDEIIELWIYGHGLFSWRHFSINEVNIEGPITDYIRNSNKDFCDIGNVHTMFKLEYKGSTIISVSVDDTEYLPWSFTTFDESKVGDPIEIPEQINFSLENGNCLSFRGLDADFSITIKKSEE
ncbi:MAG: hypothetical protein II984_07650 [Clostridia bacterium]|nr:hypothetical protein [Clostridia bacterium]